MAETLLVCFLAGMGAGIGTGFVGLSAATVISPMLIAFLGCPWYESVGIGLISDVLASAGAAYTYGKSGSLDLRSGGTMLSSVLVMTVAGSYLSQYLPNREMGLLSILCTVGMGFRFLVRPVDAPSQRFLRRSARRRTALSLLCGGAIGFYCGFVGVGGGLMMLFLLTFLLGYERKTAVGTSVFVMTFTALTGSASHFLFGHVGDYALPMVLCMAFTLLWSLLSARWANRLSPKQGGRVTGIVLLLLGAFMLTQRAGLLPG